MTSLKFMSEQFRNVPLEDLSEEEKLLLLNGRNEKPFHHNTEMLCFKLNKNNNFFSIDTNYFIGVDWLVQNKIAIYVESKLNDELKQIDFFKMLLDSLEAPENFDHLHDLFHVEYEQSWITIPKKKDLLSPIIIIQFLMLVQRIVRKGLRKSYYKKTENLNSRIKGKILIGQQIKINLFKNTPQNSVCEYQEFSFNIPENRFLKYVLGFVSTYISQKPHFFSSSQNIQLQSIIHYCLPAFENVDSLKPDGNKKINAVKNPFYNEYTDAIKIGEFILKRCSFNLNRISESNTLTPPFWIDMSKLFELYVFGKLKKIFPHLGDLTYHDKYWGGKETDILIKENSYKCVVDCKYKPQYQNETPSLKDKRQLAGYSRMKSVYTKLGIPETEIVKGMIIYSNQQCEEEIVKENLLKMEIREYVQFYKLGIKLPELQF